MRLNRRGVQSVAAAPLWIEARQGQTRIGPAVVSEAVLGRLNLAGPPACASASR